MRQSFERFQKRIRLAALLRAFLCAFSAGALVCAGLLAVIKLAALAVPLYWCAIAGGSVALPVGLLLYLIRRPTDKRAARLLDQELRLHEKVQTMIDFEGQEGDMIALQREDVIRRLEQTPLDSLKIKRLLPCVISAVLALSLLATAFVIPKKETVTPIDPNGVPTDVWELTDWHITAVRGVIDEVKASSMVESGKNEVVFILERLLTDLEPVKTVTLMKQTVITAMVKIDAVADDINTYTTILRALEASEEARVKAFASAMGSPADPITESAYQALKVGFSADTLTDDLDDFADALTVAMDGVEVDERDALYLSIDEFADSLLELVQTLPTLGDAALSEVSALFEAAAQSLSVALSQQNVNRTVSDTANNRLMSIFGILWSELPNELKYSDHAEAGTTGGDYREQDDDTITDGGKGGGETIYGSDDAVYDPESETHVKYGDIIDGYDAIKVSELEERSLSDELKELIDAYFAGLYYKNKNGN